MRHAYSMSLSAEQVTKIYNLTREIMREEGLGDIPLIVKPKVWKTAYTAKIKSSKISGELIEISNEKIQFGGKMLTGSLCPSKIYYISIYDPSSINAIRNPRRVMLAAVVASTIMEEIAHAITLRTYRRRVKSHGNEFLLTLRNLWNKHFIMLLFKLQSIYGYEGISGEDYFD